MYKRGILLLTMLNIFFLPAWAQTQQNIISKQETFVLQQVIKGLGVPWGMAFVSANEIIFTEREGPISLFNLVTTKVTRLQGLPKVLVIGQGGMLDVAVPHQFSAGDWIYFTYVKDQSDNGVTVLARARLELNRLQNWQDLLITKSATDTGRHFGSRITFDDEHVFFTVGDRGIRPNGQDLSNHAATVIRLKRNGEIPKDNPFLKYTNALSEIWSYGHRNPQGIAYDRTTQRLWLIEHGPRGGDEINLILPGRNYGWPVISYGKEYWGPFAVGEGTEREGMEQPVKQYTPSIAPGSLLVYSGKAFPNWQGNLFSGALKLRHINRVVLNKAGKAIDEERLLGDLKERIRALIEAPNGWIYFSTDSGKIYRIKPTNVKK